jgi:uncharacterized membrane protein HdeD (DUF308 family)
MAPDHQQPVDEVKTATTWVMAISAGLVFLGVLAVLLPTLAPGLFVALIGWITFVSGGLQILEAPKARPIRGFWLTLVTGALYAIAGLYIAFNPWLNTDPEALTLVLGVLLMVEGVFTIAMAFGYRVGRAQSWLVVLNGVTTLILGIFVVNRWPIGTHWLIGLYVGISLIFNGASLLAAACSVRKALSVKP